jgi:hypothetical protein
MVEKKTASAPTIAAATSHKSSEANTTDPSPVRGSRYPYRVPSSSWPPCARYRSRPLSPVFYDLRSGIRRVSSIRAIPRLTPQVVPGIQTLTARPVPKLVPEIQLPLHLPYLHSLRLLSTLQVDIMVYNCFDGVKRRGLIRRTSAGGRHE